MAALPLALLLVLMIIIIILFVLFILFLTVLRPSFMPFTFIVLLMTMNTGVKSLGRLPR